MNSQTGGSVGPVAPPEGNLFATKPLTRDEWIEGFERKLQHGRRLLKRIADLESDPRMRQTDANMFIELFDGLSDRLQTVPFPEQEE